MREQTVRRLCALSLLLLLNACDDDGPVDSEDVGTAEIYAVMSAVAGDAGSVTVTTELRNGIGDSAAYLHLVGDDRLVASNGQPIDAIAHRDNLFDNAIAESNNVALMQERDVVEWEIGFIRVLSGKPEYFAQFPEADRAAGFYVSFDRSVDAKAENTLITLPPPFEILSPDPASSISRTQSIDLQWSNPSPADSGDTMRIVLGGRCEDGETFQYSAPLNDTGSASIAGGDFYPPDLPADQSCAVTIALERTRLGSVANAFGYGGYAQGIERRTVTVTSAP